jgi:iron complex transport system substrate-binding protein
MTQTIEGPNLTLPAIDDVTRREFLFGAAGLLILPAACGGEGGNEGSGRTRTFEHAMGTSEVPAKPRRVVALGDLLIFDPLVELGVPMVGVIETQNALGNTEDVDKVGAQAEPNLEAIAALEPDLIVGDALSHSAELYERLSEIAPTAFARDFLDGDALDRPRFIADLVGRSERFDELLAKYEGRVEEIRDRLEPIRDSLKISPLNPYADDDAIYVYREESFGGVKVLADLGISLSSGVRELPGDDSMPFTSFELIPELDADVIFALFDPRSEESERDAFRSSPLLQQTFASRNDQVLEVNSDPWYGASFLALNLVLDDIERYLLGREIDTSADFR